MPEQERAFTPATAGLDLGLPPSSGTRSGRKRRRDALSKTPSGSQGAVQGSSPTPKADPAAKKKKGAKESAPVIINFKCRHMNAKWQKKNPTAKKTAINKLLVNSFRYTPTTASAFYDHLKSIYRGELTYPDEEEKEVEDGERGNLWEITYAIGANGKDWSPVQINDEEQFQSMLEDAKRSKTIWLELYEFKPLHGDDESEAEGTNNNTARYPAKRKEPNQVDMADKINEFSTELQKLHKCTQHASPWCWKAQPGDRHIPLNMGLIKAWSTAMARTDNPHTDYHKPPNDRAFNIKSGRATPNALSIATPSRSPSMFTESHRSVNMPHQESLALAPPMQQSSSFSSFAGSSPTNYMSSLRTSDTVRPTKQSDFHIPSKGKMMDLDEFCAAYQLPLNVKTALEDEDIDGPDCLLETDPDLYREDPKNPNPKKKGLGLKLGTAFRLKEAMSAWTHGFSSRAEWQASKADP